MYIKSSDVLHVDSLGFHSLQRGRLITEGFLPWIVCVPIMALPASRPQLDHIIYLLSLSQLQSLPPIFSSNFTILLGGRHTDGATENKLIILKDGVYLELISFVDEEKRKSHWWGDSKEGTVIDFAYTLGGGNTAGDDGSTANSDIEAKAIAFTKIQKAIADSSEKVHYNDPVAGSRTKPTGETIAWKVAFPAAAIPGHQSRDRPAVPSLRRGEVPFWCFDATPRSRRVPQHVEENVEHPCQAVGVAYICVMVPRARVKELMPVYEQVHGGTPGAWVAEGDDRYGMKGGHYHWQCDVPAPVDERVPGNKVEILLKPVEDGESDGRKGVKIAIGLWKRTADGRGWEVFELG